MMANRVVHADLPRVCMPVDKEGRRGSFPSGDCWSQLWRLQAKLDEKSLHLAGSMGWSRVRGNATLVYGLV